jgi:hypothetical protein
MRVWWLVVMAGVAASPSPLGTSGGQPADADNVELMLLFEADQADRQLPMGDIDWQVVSKRDEARLSRVKELYQSDALRTGKDWWRAALVLQHSQVPEDHLLAHEMCIAALVRGERSAASLAAATEDRFLRGIGRSQRFGTQYESSGPKSPLLLAPVQGGVTDALRAVLDVPALPAPGTEFRDGL